MIHIRRAGEDDLHDIENVENACFDRNRFEGDVIRVLLTDPDFATWVADSKGRILGYASLMHREGNDFSRLLSIAVLPDDRGQGIGRALLRDVKEFVQRDPDRKLSLEVRIVNVAAINLYLRSGFRIVGLLKDYYDGGREGPEDALYMVLESS